MSQIVWVTLLLLLVSSIVGFLPLLFLKKVSQKFSTFFLGICAGVMLCVSFFSLLEPAFSAFMEQGWSHRASIIGVSLCFFIGALSLYVLNFFLPHEHLMHEETGKTLFKKNFSRATLITLAIAMHNLPEGLAVGIHLHKTTMSAITYAIAFQDIPEGFIVALGLLGLGLSLRKIFSLTCIIGFVEVVGALLGFGFTTFSHAFLPYGLAFCAGTMFFVVQHEMIPEAFAQGYDASATFGNLLGFLLALVLEKSIM